MSIKVLIADKHVVVREAIRSLIKKQPDMEIVAEADNGIKALNLSLELKPDVIIIDVFIPSLNGVDVTKQIIGGFPNAKVMALSMCTNSILISDMIKAGASGYILKDCLFNELSDAIRIVFKGGVYLSPLVLSMVVNKYISFLPDIGGLPLETLTERENEVLHLLGTGENIKQISQRLQVSIHVIERHCHMIIKKLNNSNLADVVMGSIFRGFASFEISRND